MASARTTCAGEIYLVRNTCSRIVRSFSICSSLRLLSPNVLSKIKWIAKQPRQKDEAVAFEGTVLTETEDKRVQSEGKMGWWAKVKTKNLCNICMHPWSITVVDVTSVDGWLMSSWRNAYKNLIWLSRLARESWLSSCKLPVNRDWTRCYLFLDLLSFHRQVITCSINHVNWWWTWSTSIDHAIIFFSPLSKTHEEFQIYKNLGK